MGVYINTDFMEHKPLLPSEEHTASVKLPTLADTQRLKNKKQKKPHQNTEQVLSSWDEESS